MKTRILAGLALVPLLLLVALGGLPLYIGEFVIVAIAIHEFYKAFETKKNEGQNVNKKINIKKRYDFNIFLQ